MNDLILPLDCEQLPELWQLRRRLAEASHHDGTTPADKTKLILEAAAAFLFLRLFVTLGYAAKSTNKPGLLPPAGCDQLRASLDPLFGDDCDPIELLTHCGLLQLLPQPARTAEGVGPLTPVEEDYFCPLFARLNPHLAGDYKPPHIKGNLNSRLSAALKNIAGDAPQQALLLPSDVFQHQDGVRMTPEEAQAAVALIRSLDRCLMAPSRSRGGFSPGLMATAAAVVARHDPEALRTFYYWLVNHREHPALPATADALLAGFDKYFELAAE